MEKLTEETLRDWGHLKELLSICEGRALSGNLVFYVMLYFKCILCIISAQRQIGETLLNEKSSRSHQIIRLVSPSTGIFFDYNIHFYA